MYETLRNFIDKYASAEISDADFQLVKERFIPKHYRKNQYLLQDGEISKHLIFIAKGALRQYSIDAKGTEHIIQLGIENWWMGDRESFTMLIPTPYNIDAVEDTDVLLLNKAGFESLLTTVPLFMAVLNKMDYKNHVATQKRIHAAISFTAEERYLDLVATSPELLQRFPQTLIASYLGVSPETISRIRKKAHP